MITDGIPLSILALDVKSRAIIAMTSPSPAFSRERSLSGHPIGVRALIQPDVISRSHYLTIKHFLTQLNFPVSIL
jgi:hypothetical protein